MKFIIIFFLAISSYKLHSETRSLGHLLSRNDYMMDESKCMLGLEFSGCKVGSSTLVGISPFLYTGYELNNIYIRHRLKTDESTTHTIDFGVVDNIHKKDPNSDDYIVASEYEAYDMQAFMFNYITTFYLSNKSRLSFNNSLFYYTNYHKPFSLRRPDPSLKKLQLNSSLLFETPFTDSLTMCSELGFLQFNGDFPRIQAGASLDFHRSKFLFKLGFSVTSTLSGFFVSKIRPNRGDYQQELLQTKEGYYQKLDREKIKYDFALHPEINIQYEF